MTIISYPQLSVKSAVTLRDLLGRRQDNVSVRDDYLGLKPRTAGGKKQSTVSELLYQDLGSI